MRAARVLGLLFGSWLFVIAALPVQAEEEGEAVSVAAQPTEGGTAPGAAQEEAEEAPGGVERLVVTARKREESLQDVPLSVTGFSEDMLEGLGVAQTDDAAALAPNLYLTQTPGSVANMGVSIRGIGAAEPLLTRDRGVAIYVDGAYIARNAGSVFDLIDLQRLEVLRGPQGTLWGRNATGGAVHFISRRPSEELGFEQSVSYGNYDYWLTRTRFDTGELGDTGLKSTFTYLAKARDGYVNDRNSGDRSDPGAYDVDAFRIALGWDPVEDFSAFYSFDYSRHDGQDAYFQLEQVSGDLAASLDPATTLKVDDDRIGVANMDFHDKSIHRINGHNLTLDFDWGITNLKSITTYREWDNTENGTELDGNAGVIGTGTDFMGGFFPVPGIQLFAATNERNQHQVSQEIQFYGPIGERLDYVTGFYYFREAFDELNPQQFWFPVSGLGAGIPLTSTLDYEGEAESWAGYTDWIWTPPVLDDRLKLSAGVRYTRDEKNFSQASPVAVAGEDTWRHVDWQGTGSFDWTDSLMTYVRVATGYNSGGFNPRSNTALPFDEEEIITYEAGAKTRFFDDRVQLNGAVFYSEYDDIQIDQFAAGAAGASSITVNAGEATIWGIELEALAQITDHVSGYLNYGWIDPEYQEFEVRNPVTDVIVDIADEAVFAYRPQQTLSAGLGFESDPIGQAGLVLGVRVDALYVDDLYWHAFDFIEGIPVTPFNDQIKEGGYTLFHSSVTLSEIPVGERSKLKFMLWGRNLLDEEYRRSGIDFGALGFAGAMYGEPRTYGLTATFEY